MFYLVEGELKPEHNICIDKISRKDDGPPPAIKINNINNEFGEGKILLNLIKFILLINYKYNI